MLCSHEDTIGLDLREAIFLYVNVCDMCYKVPECLASEQHHTWKHSERLSRCNDSSSKYSFAESKRKTKEFLPWRIDIRLIRSKHFELCDCANCAAISSAKCLIHQIMDQASSEEPSHKTVFGVFPHLPSPLRRTEGWEASPTIQTRLQLT